MKIESKTHELNVFADPGVMYVETRDKTHKSDYRYVVETGFIQGEPVDMPLNAAQVGWIGSKRFQEMEQEMMGVVTKLPVSDILVTPETFDKKTGMIDCWKAEVAVGHTVLGFAEWEAAVSVIGYKMTPDDYKLLTVIRGMVDQPALHELIIRLVPVYDVP